jgi:hypothetical protein
MMARTVIGLKLNVAAFNEALQRFQQKLRDEEEQMEGIVLKLLATAPTEYALSQGQIAEVRKVLNTPGWKDRLLAYMLVDMVSDGITAEDILGKESED